MAKVSVSLRAPPLSSAILEHIAADWDGFAKIRSAARALSQKSRLTNKLSIAVNEVRVALAAALLSTGHTASSATALSRDDEAVWLDTIESIEPTRSVRPRNLRGPPERARAGASG
jgi:hypothetical protein